MNEDVAELRVPDVKLDAYIRGPRRRRASPRQERPSVGITFAPGGVLPVPNVAELAASGMSRTQRRKAVRQAARQRRRTAVLAQVTEEMIPPGSLLSDATLDAIRRGDYYLTGPPPRRS